MTVALKLGLNLTAVRSQQAVTLSAYLQSRNTSLFDFLSLALTTTDDLTAAVTAPWRLIGITVELDDGSGLRVLNSRELGPQVSVHRSLDAIGRTAQFTWFCPKFSPLVSNLLRGQRRVRITGYMGTNPATVQSRILLDGYTRTASFAAMSPAASIEAQDASVKTAGQRLTINIPEGSGRSRASVLEQITGIYGIALGAVDLPGTVNKSIAVGNDVNVLDWIKSFITPTGRRMRFNLQNQLEIGRFDETGEVVRRLQPKDVSNLTIVPPGTLDANNVSMTATAVTLVSSVTSSSGTASRTVTDVLTTGDYTPQTAVRVQDHLTGAISEVIAPPASHDSRVSRVIAATELDILFNTVTITETVDNYGWYAQRAAPYHIADSAGTLSWNGIFDVYFFSDGSARAVTTETFQHLSRTTTVKTYTNGVLTQSLVTEDYWDADAQNPFVAGAWSNGSLILATANRAQWPVGTDNYFSTARQTITTYTLAADGVHLTSIYQVINQFASGASSFAGYTYLNTGDPTSGQVTETLQSGAHAQQYAAAAAATNAPQSLTATVTDSVRVALDGGVTIVSQQQNDFCESLAELKVAACFALRDLSKIQVQFDMLADLILDDGKVFTLPIPNVGSGDVPVVAGSVDTMIDGSTGESSQHVVGWYYPLNLPTA